jgi:hypothetical protein
VRLFRREGAVITASLEPHERVVLVTLMTTLRAVVLGEPLPGHEEQDLTARVLPPASRKDPEVAREFAELTGEGLRRDKAARLGRLADRLSEPDGVTLKLDEADDVAAALADARLITAELCGMDAAIAAMEDPTHEADDAPSEQAMWAEFYRLLSAMQSTLVDAIMTPPEGR